MMTKVNRIKKKC